MYKWWKMDGAITIFVFLCRPDIVGEPPAACRPSTTCPSASLWTYMKVEKHKVLWDLPPKRLRSLTEHDVVDVGPWISLRSVAALLKHFLLSFQQKRVSHSHSGQEQPPSYSHLLPLTDTIFKNQTILDKNDLKGFARKKYSWILAEFMQGGEKP